MVLLKYFRKIEFSIDEQVKSILPKPHGSLSLMMPSSSIAAANCKVRKIMKSDKEKGGTGSRGKYQHHTEKKKAEIAKKALELVWHYTHNFTLFEN